MKFINQPNLHLTSTKWDAGHLDRFLDSEWGDKLFNASRFRSESAEMYPPKPAFENSIRPSVSFLSQPRVSTQPCVLKSDETLGNTSPFPLQAKSYKPSPVLLSQQRLHRGERIKSLERRAAELTDAQAALLLPKRRRDILQKKLETLSKLKDTKTKHGLDTKLNRILEGAFPRGLTVTVQSASCCKTANVQYSSPRQQGKVKAVIHKNTRTSPDVEFSNPAAAQPEYIPIRRGQMHVPGNPTFLETRAHIFEAPPQRHWNQARMMHLIHQDRGLRNFNIISGASVRSSSSTPHH
jgi:hypothetical protein